MHTYNESTTYSCRGRWRLPVRDRSSPSRQTLQVAWLFLGAWAASSSLPVHVCMYVYMYICMYALELPLHFSLCMYVCMHINKCMYVNKYTHVHAWASVRCLSVHRPRAYAHISYGMPEPSNIHYKNHTLTYLAYKRNTHYKKHTLAYLAYKFRHLLLVDPAFHLFDGTRHPPLGPKHVCKTAAT
jgi:hypothetical protein